MFLLLQLNLELYLPIKMAINQIKWQCQATTIVFFCTKHSQFKTLTHHPQFVRILWPCVLGLHTGNKTFLQRGG